MGNRSGIKGENFTNLGSQTAADVEIWREINAKIRKASKAWGATEESGSQRYLLNNYIKPLQNQCLVSLPLEKEIL